MKGLRIATPCPASWEAMDGDERMRHCAVCDLNVYNFAEMTRDEVHALIARSEGRVCARLYRRADGTVLTRDCPTGLRELPRRASRAAAAAVAALLSLPAFALGAPTSKNPNIKVTTEKAAAAQPAAFAGVVLMVDGPLPGATVTRHDEATGRTFTTVTDVNGAFTFPSLGDGSYRALMTLPGFKPAMIEHLELTSGVITHASIRLEAVEQLMGIVFTDVKTTHEPMSTTFTQSFIDKLPR